MVLVRARLGNHVDDAAGDSTELHFVVVRLHFEFLNFVDDGGDRVGREGHFRIVNAVQQEIVAGVGLNIYGGKREVTDGVGLSTTDVLRGTDRGDDRREVEKLSKVSPIQRKASYLLRLDDAAQSRVSGLDVNGGRLDHYGLLVRSNAQYEILIDFLLHKQSQILLHTHTKSTF